MDDEWVQTGGTAEEQNRQWQPPGPDGTWMFIDEAPQPGQFTLIDLAMKPPGYRQRVTLGVYPTFDAAKVAYLMLRSAVGGT